MKKRTELDPATPAHPRPHFFAKESGNSRGRGRAEQARKLTVEILVYKLVIITSILAASISSDTWDKKEIPEKGVELRNTKKIKIHLPAHPRPHFWLD